MKDDCCLSRATFDADSIRSSIESFQASGIPGQTIYKYQNCSKCTKSYQNVSKRIIRFGEDLKSIVLFHQQSLTPDSR
jgi:hypothetical protein